MHPILQLKKQPISNETALGYASRAILTALIRQLIASGALSQETAMLVRDEAIASLRLHGGLRFVDHAVADCMEIVGQNDD